MFLLVDVEELRSLVRGADHGGFTGEALQDRLQTADRVIRKLIAGGHLKTETVINPTAEEVERFEREFVSLFMLAKQQGRHFRAERRRSRPPASSRRWIRRWSGRRSIDGAKCR